jgi:flagellar basal-body rod modification protein FlgD
MIDTNTLTSVLGQNSVAGASRKAAASLNSQDQFLTLMLAQLKNQDPLKPMEPAQFLGQLAQFSTVTGIQDMKTSVSDLSQSLRSAQMISGTNLVGHSILSAGSAVRFDGTGTVSASAGSPSGTTRIEVGVRDASGALVRRFEVSPQGDFTDFAWDGRTDAGELAAAGSYKLEAVGVVNGQSQSLELLTPSKVNSVTIDTQGTGLILNTSAGSVALGDVRRVM